MFNKTEVVSFRITQAERKALVQLAGDGRGQSAQLLRDLLRAEATRRGVQVCELAGGQRRERIA